MHYYGTFYCELELGVIEQTLHGWRKAHRQGKLAGASSNGKPISPEQMELSRVRAENARLKMEVEILKKATGAQPRVRRLNNRL